MVWFVWSVSRLPSLMLTPPTVPLTTKVWMITSPENLFEALMYCVVSDDFRSELLTTELKFLWFMVTTSMFFLKMASSKILSPEKNNSILDTIKTTRWNLKAK